VLEVEIQREGVRLADILCENRVHRCFPANFFPLAAGPQALLSESSPASPASPALPA
jgi:hypothetical protein